jgi:AAA+ superfamily predicted ATPase
MESAVRPFRNAQEQMDACLAFLDGLCAAYLAIQQAQTPEAFEGRGVVIPESQVTVALSGQTEIEPHEGYLSHLRYLQERTRLSPEFPLTRLLKKLCATDFQQLVVVLALAAEQNRKYERVFAYLQDNVTEKRPTLGLAADLYSLIDRLEEKELFGLYDDRHPLNRFVLMPGRADRSSASGLSRPLAIRQATLLALTETDTLPEPLPASCTVYRRVAPIEPLTAGAQLEQARRFCEYARSRPEDGRPALLQIYGAPGTGRRFALRYLAEKLKTDILALDCSVLSGLGADARRLLVETAVSWCFLTGGIPALLNFDFPRLSESDRATLSRSLLREFGDAAPLFILSGESPLRIRYGEHFRTLQLQIPPLSITEQVGYWKSFSGVCSLPLEEGTDLLRLANAYSLTPGQIEQVLSIAEMECISRGIPAIGEAAISYAVRLLCRPRLIELSQPLNTHFSWEDLMLETEEAETLHRICDRIRYRWQVKEDWGFERKLPYGKGISVLLYGPSGTGKTMAAQVLAREFGLDAYRVDLSRIMDKYIGETEKKLGELFDAAKDSNAILFFDEADALFAKRTEIQDSKDRYANVETAYLLQRMEEHNGISIMATNIAQNFDEAFKRRISFMVHIPMPSAETRLRIWRAVFPAEAPLHANVDLAFFAERFELSGSAIKNVAVSAAYLAAADGSEIRREHIARALKEEYRKTGRVLTEIELY